MSEKRTLFGTGLPGKCGGRGTGPFAPAALIVALITMLLIRACPDPIAEIPVSVTGVRLSRKTLAIAAGNMETLAATVNPAGAANKAVIWVPDNPAAATVAVTPARAVTRHCEPGLPGGGLRKKNSPKRCGFYLVLLLNDGYNGDWHFVKIF
jgi:hypothetical protein